MSVGKKVWIIPDCELPQEGEGVLKGHESVIIVNDNDEDANINVTIYFDDEDIDIKWPIEGMDIKLSEKDKKGIRFVDAEHF